MDDNASGKMTVEDAIRLKNEINKDITYGRSGLNAKQIQEMEELTKAQYSEVGQALSFIKKHWWFFPDYFWAIGIVISLLVFFFFNQRLVQVVSVAAIIYCAAQLAYRAGVNYGFVRGYEDGHTVGVRKAFGVSCEDASAIHERAIEMEMDEMLIKRLDKRKEKES